MSDYQISKVPADQATQLSDTRVPATAETLKDIELLLNGGYEGRQAMLRIKETGQVKLEEIVTPLIGKCGTAEGNHFVLGDAFAVAVEVCSNASEMAPGEGELIRALGNAALSHPNPSERGHLVRELVPLVERFPDEVAATILAALNHPDSETCVHAAIAILCVKQDYPAYVPLFKGGKERLITLLQAEVENQGTWPHVMVQALKIIGAKRDLEHSDAYKKAVNYGKGLRGWGESLEARAADRFRS